MPSVPFPSSFLQHRTCSCTSRKSGKLVRLRRNELRKGKLDKSSSFHMKRPHNLQKDGRPPRGGDVPDTPAALCLGRRRRRPRRVCVSRPRARPRRAAARRRPSPRRPRCPRQGCQQHTRTKPGGGCWAGVAYCVVYVYSRRLYTAFVHGTRAPQWETQQCSTAREWLHRHAREPPNFSAT